MPALMTRDAGSWVWLPCARARSATRRRRRRRSIVLEVVEVLIVVCVFAEGRFDSCERDFLHASAWDVNLHACLSSRFDAKGALVRLGERRVDASSADHDVRGVLKVVRDVDIRDSVRRRRRRLHSLDFKTDVGEGALTLLVEGGVVAWKFG